MFLMMEDNFLANGNFMKKGWDFVFLYIFLCKNLGIRENNIYIVCNFASLKRIII